MFEALSESIILFSGTGEGNLEEAEALIEPYLQKFPNVCDVYCDEILRSCVERT